MHPMAFKNDNGANGMKAGDRFRYKIDGCTGVVDELLQDGDAYVTFDGEVYDCIKWHHMEKI